MNWYWGEGKTIENKISWERMKILKEGIIRHYKRKTFREKEKKSSRRPIYLRISNYRF